VTVPYAEVSRMDKIIDKPDERIKPRKQFDSAGGL
jgi:hypothetical protein